MGDSSRFCERLAMLLRAQRGLLARLHEMKARLTMSMPGCLADHPKIQDHVVSKFPDTSVEKHKKHYDRFAAAATGICQVLDDDYKTFLAIWQFKRASLNTLKEVFKDTWHFSFAHNAILTRDTFDLLVGYVRLHLLLSHTAQTKIVIGMYGAAYMVVNRVNEAQFEMLAAYVKQFESPLRQIKTELIPISPFVGAALGSFAEAWYQTQDVNEMRRRAMFDMTDRPEEMSQPALHSLYTNLLYVDRLYDWIMYGFLVCPEVLGANAKAKAVLVSVLGDGFVATAFRERPIYVHAKYEELHLWCIKNKFMNESAKQVTKLVTECEDKAIVESCLVHQNRRAYARQSMRRILRLISECPGLLATKLPVVFAALSLARSELCWFFRHDGVAPRQSNRGFFAKAAAEKEDIDWDDRAIDELVHLVVELIEVIKKYSPIVQKYYLEYLRGAHATALRKQIEGCRWLSKNNTARNHVSNICTSVMQLPASGKELQDALQKIRFNWSRAMGLMCATGVQQADKPSLKGLMKRLNVLVAHTRYVDRLLQEVVEFASPKQLWWYRAKMERVFFKSLSKGRAAQANARHCLALVKYLHSATENVRSACPVELQQIGNESVLRAEKGIERIAWTICTALRYLYDETCGLQGTSALVKIIVARSANRGVLLPGAESHPSRRKHVMGMIMAGRHVAQLCWALRSSEMLVVFDTEFYPSQFLRHLMRTQLKKFIREETARHLDNPSRILEAFTRYTSVMQIASFYTEVEVAGIVRETLESELAQGVVANLGVPVPATLAASPVDEGSYAMTLCAHFLNFVKRVADENGTESGLVFSSSHGGFARWHVADGARSTTDAYAIYLRASAFLGPAQLEPVVTLLGPVGLRMVDSHLLGQAVLPNAKSMLQMLKGNKGKLRKFIAAATANDPAESLAAALAMSPKALRILLQSAVVVGTALLLRRCMHRAMAAVCKNRVPFIRHWPRGVADAVLPDEASKRHGSTVPIAVATLMEATGDVGGAGDSGAAGTETHGAVDVSLTAVLSELQSTTDDVEAWRLLPAAIAAAFTSRTWTGAMYLPKLKAYSNNLHVVPLALRSLTRVFEGLLRSERPPASSLAYYTPPRLLAVQEQLKIFVECGSTTLLAIKAVAKDYVQWAGQFQSKLRGMPVNAMYMLMEIFVEECDELDCSVVQKHMPFHLLHQAFVDVVLGKQGSEDSKMDTHETLSNAIDEAHRSRASSFGDHELAEAKR